MVYLNPAKSTSDRGDIEALDNSSNLEAESVAQPRPQPGPGTSIKRLLLISLMAILFNSNCSFASSLVVSIGW